MSPRKKNSNKNALANRKASQFAFKTHLSGPISELSVLRRSLLFAEISMISYLAPIECNEAAGMLGFLDGKVFNVGGIQAHWFQNEHDGIMVFRGAEIDDGTELDSSIDTLKTLAETVGQINQGFKTQADGIWPVIEQSLEKNTRAMWFCGHSIGGALANICAGRCMASYIKTEPEELYSFGSPRIGCGRYVHHVKLQHYRWVNNNDIVTKKPSALAGYRHSGTEMYLDRYGNLVDAYEWGRLKDRMLGVLSGIRAMKIGALADHSILRYIDCIFEIVRADEARGGNKTRPGTVPANRTTVEETQPVS